MSDDFSRKVQTLISQIDQIGQDRKAILEALANKIADQLQEHGFSKIIFVCTHNSRRSQLAQIWFWQAIRIFDLAAISSYSGGTEVAAFNHRMVEALRRFGFEIVAQDKSSNPRYALCAPDAKDKGLVLFSKTYSDDFNPQKDFIAVMVCGQADEGCPFVPGAYGRVSLPYDDPKAADDTKHESITYDAKVAEIGREMLYLAKALKQIKQG